MENHSSPITRKKDYQSDCQNCSLQQPNLRGQFSSKEMLEMLAGATAQQTTQCHLRWQCQTLSKISILLQYILAREGGGEWMFCFVLFCSWLFYFCNCCFQHHLRGWNVSFLPLPAVSFSTWQMLTTTPAAPRRTAATGTAFLFSLPVICVIRGIYSPGMWFLNQYAFSFPKECLVLQPQLWKNTLILTNEGVVALLR